MYRVFYGDNRMDINWASEYDTAIDLWNAIRGYPPSGYWDVAFSKLHRIIKIENDVEESSVIAYNCNNGPMNDMDVYRFVKRNLLEELHHPKKGVNQRIVDYINKVYFDAFYDQPTLRGDITCMVFGSERGTFLMNYREGKNIGSLNEHFIAQRKIKYRLENNFSKYSDLPLYELSHINLINGWITAEKDITDITFTKENLVAIDDEIYFASKIHS
jgi:hypothetical protein